MDIFEEIHEFLDAAWRQISNESAVNNSTDFDKREIYFTRNFYQTAEEFGLSEADAEDVYQYGYRVKQNTMVREYYGYEVGIHYFMSQETGQPVISSIWRIQYEQ